jgi:hypothetical protein
MQKTTPRRRHVARLLSTLSIVSVLTLATVGSASAQAAPTPAAPVTLDQARAAAMTANAGDGITAIYIPAQQTLVVIGTAQDDAIAVKRNAAGRIVVNGGAVPIHWDQADGRQHDRPRSVRSGRQRRHLVRRIERRAAERPDLGGDSTDTVTFEGVGGLGVLLSSQQWCRHRARRARYALVLLRRPGDREPRGQA